MFVERRGPTVDELKVRSKESRLSRQDCTTEELGWKPDEVPEWGRRRKCPRKLSELRRKLYQKAKREPSVSVQVRSWLLVHACGEICGSAGCGKSARPVRRGRGSWTQQVRPLYSTGNFFPPQGARSSLRSHLGLHPRISENRGQPGPP